ncbi:MAG: flippase-like domain-containing protein [Thermoleophilia bacterium]|nr:flippase-like domain-containing protein [Thermoleophilia bacterium]
MRTPRLPSTRRGRLAVLVPVALAALAVLVWRAPDLGVVGDAFALVDWGWVAVAIVANLASIAVRSVAWRIVVDQALPAPAPRHRAVFAAFSIGLLGNAALPGRVGEVARVLVLARHVRRKTGAWATLIGTVLAHRLLDVVVAVALVVYVVYAARIPDWARPALAIVLGIGVGVLIAGLLLARRENRLALEGLGPVRRVLRLARQGLTVLKRPNPAVLALVFQILGWAAQLGAVAATLRAFEIDAPVAAAALVLVVMNLVMVFPLWPGNVGVVQAAIALSLLAYGVGYARGFAFGIGLQAIEAGVGVALGLVFLAREGFSFAMLRRIDVADVDVNERVERVA